MFQMTQVIEHWAFERSLFTSGLENRFLLSFGAVEMPRSGTHVPEIV